jgi:AHBA synthesis associated protein
VLKAVLFDLDGVLVESFHAWLELTRQAVREIGDGSLVTEEEFRARWGQSVEADVRRWFPHLTVPELERWYADNFKAHLVHLHIDAHAALVLDDLRARGLRTALVTNTPFLLAKHITDGANLNLDALVGGTDTPNAKPAPDMVLRALELVGTKASDAIMVGDTDNDRLAAQSAGVRFVGFRCDGDDRIETLVDLQRIV